MDTFDIFVQIVKTPAGVALSVISALLGGAIGCGVHVLKCRISEQSAQKILDQKAQHLRIEQIRIDRHQCEDRLIASLGVAADLTSELVQSLDCMRRGLSEQHLYSTPSAEEAAADKLASKRLATVLLNTGRRWLDGHVALHEAAASVGSISEVSSHGAGYHGFTWLPPTTEQARLITLDRLRSDIHANISGVASFVDGGLQLWIDTYRGGGRVEADWERSLLRDSLKEVTWFADVWSRYLAWYERGLRGVLRQIEQARLDGQDTACMECAEALRSLLLVNPLLLTCHSVAGEVELLHGYQFDVGGIPMARDLYRADQRPG